MNRQEKIIAALHNAAVDLAVGVRRDFKGYVTGEYGTGCDPTQVRARLLSSMVEANRKASEYWAEKQYAA